MADLIQEQINKMLYKATYLISESPTYKSILEDAVFDEIPEAEVPVSVTDENPMSSAAPVSTPPDANTAPTASPAPTGDPTPPASAPMPPPPPAPDMGTTPTPMGTTNGFSEPVVDEKEEMQKEVMRLQIDAMKQMSAKIKELEDTMGGLNSQLAVYSKEVEKVKEPTDVEKFQERKLDSHPYYYNLNDLWNNNTFQARMDGMNSKGIVKTDDGFIADFDQLPKLSQYEVKNSFDNFNK